MSMTLQGLTDVFHALEKVQQTFAAARRKAFTRIAIKLKGDSIKKTPIEYGNLRGSAFIEVTDDYARVGYTSKYAVFVHENMEVNRGKKRPSGLGSYWQGGGPKFLERAAQENEQFIIDELKKAAPK